MSEPVKSFYVRWASDLIAEHLAEAAVEATCADFSLICYVPLKIMTHTYQIFKTFNPPHPAFLTPSD